MVTQCISPSCVTLLLTEDETPNLRFAVSACLLAAGHLPWLEIEAEQFSLAGRTLLIARPRSPLRSRLAAPRPRLHRS